MADLQELLQEAGRALDQRAPVFDAASLVVRPVPPADDLMDPSSEPSGWRAPRGIRRRALVIGAAAAVLVVVAATFAAVRVEGGAVSAGPDPAAPGGPTVASDLTGSSVPAVADAVDVLEVDCAGADTAVRSPRVRAQREGVQIVVHTPYPSGAIIDLGSLGGQGLAPGDHVGVMLKSLAPGRGSLTCRSAEDVGPPPARVDFEIVDDQGLWVDPTLACSLPGAPIGSREAEVGPYRSTPEDAIRTWQGVLDDTPIRQVGYPGEPGPRYVAELTGGQVLFSLDRSHDGQWRATAAQWCTSVPPSVRADSDPGQAWYDTEELGDVRDQLGRLQLRGDDAGKAPAERITDARLWCSDLSLQSRRLGDVAPAPAIDLDALRQEALDQVVAASAACPEDEAAVLADGAFAASDDHLASATDTLDGLRRRIEAGG